MIASGESGTDDQGDPPTETGPAAHRRQRPREGKSGSLMALRNPARATPARADRKEGCTWQGRAGDGASPDGRPRSVGSRSTWCQPPALGTGGRLVSLSVTSTAAEARLCAGPCGCSPRDPILADVLETVGKVAGPALQRSSSPSSKFGHGHEQPSRAACHRCTGGGAAGVPRSFGCARRGCHRFPGARPTGSTGASPPRCTPRCSAVVHRCGGRCGERRLRRP